MTGVIVWRQVPVLTFVRDDIQLVFRICSVGLPIQVPELQGTIVLSVGIIAFEFGEFRGCAVAALESEQVAYTSV